MGTSCGQHASHERVLLFVFVTWLIGVDAITPHHIGITSASAVDTDSRLPDRGSRGLRGAAQKKKKLVIVCNAFPDVRPAYVGVLASTDSKKDALNAVSRLQSMLSSEAVPKKGGTLWMRSIAYGACEEYHTDLDHRRLFFLPPGNGSQECEFNARSESMDQELTFAQQQAHSVSLAPVLDGEFGRLVVVLKQPVQASTQCVATPVSLPDAELGTAELVVLDAYARKSKVEEGLEEEEIEMEKKDAAMGLSPLPPLDTGSVIRLEDKVESWTIATEVVGSRTLSPGQVYQVEPKTVHVVLEDLRGSNVFDNRDIDFEAGHTYVGMRVGRADDTSFPQKLVFYPLLYNVEG